MLCPDCHRSAPGGTPCPVCGRIVPDQESLSGQGSRYFVVLVTLSLAFLILYVLATTLGGPGPGPTLQRLAASGWIWLLLGIFFIPISIGVYYWMMLREEEVIVTDEGITRHSRWGDESLRWDEVRAFNRQPILFRQTRLGRISGLSRFFARGVRKLDLPPVCYELVGPPNPIGNPRELRLEPGTIEELPWLLQLIEEHVGPPVDV